MGNIIKEYDYFNGENLKMVSDYDIDSDLKVDLYCDFSKNLHNDPVSNCYISVSSIAGSLVKKIPVKNIDKKSLTIIQISPDATHIYLENNRVAHYYNILSGELVHTSDAWTNSFRIDPDKPAFSPNSQYVISRKNKKFFIFDLKTGDQRSNFLENMFTREMASSILRVNFDDESDYIVAQGLFNYLWLFSPRYFSERDLYEYYKSFDIAEEDLDWSPRTTLLY